MTKGTREYRKMARQQREFQENPEKAMKQQARENRKSKVRTEKPVMGREEYVQPQQTVETREDLVIGRNAVIELLKTDRTIDALYIASGSKEGSMKVIINKAIEKKLVIKEVERKKLDGMSEGLNHQGVIAQVTPFVYSEVAEIIKYAKDKNEAPFIVILDEIEDPHNLGSIIRTAELCGVHGIIIPKRRNVGITSTVYKCSVGAIEHMRIAKVTNINATIDELKAEGIWVYGAALGATEFSYQVDFSGPCAIIIGNEGKGISQLTQKKCDKLVKIPMIGKINSLNASVAGGIMMYEVLKGRLDK